MNRTRLSLINAISAVFLTVVNSILGIIATKLIIVAFGSDFNGLNSTATQIVNVLLILEGGFSLASNVALFAPITERNYGLVNGILAATRKKFKKVGIVFLSIGIVISVGYAFLVNSLLSRGLIALVIFMAIVPQAFNFFYSISYRVLLQSQQKEYVISLSTSLTLGLGYITNIIIIKNGGSMWMIRFVTMLFSIINCFIVAGIAKHNNPFINIDSLPRENLIVGTRDVMVQKITGVIYTSFPIVFLSISSFGGTKLASVYAVYNNIFIMIKSLLHGVVDAPRLGFGQMIIENDRETVWKAFKQYEYLAFFAVYVMLSTTTVLLLPFVEIYTSGISDISYYDPKLALLMISISCIELIHIPSGHMICMAGEFKVSKRFQLIACVVLIITMIGGGYLWEVYGMLLAVLFTALLLACLELSFIHTSFFGNKVIELLRMLLPLIFGGVVTCIAESAIPFHLDSYLDFMVMGVAFVVINIIVGVTISWLFNRTVFCSLIKRAKNLIRNK